MRTKVVCNILFIIFGVLIINMCSNYEKTVERQTMVSQMLMENQSIEETLSNTSLPYSDSTEDITSTTKSNSMEGSTKSQDSTSTDDSTNSQDSTSAHTSGMPGYTALYPDMYVTSTISNNYEDGEKVAYLTFDDGPSKVTGDIIKILKENDVPATFFVLGSTITESGEEYLKEMAKEGYAIGIHTYSHKQNEIYSSVESFLDDFYLVYNQIIDITGVKPTIYRFPYGSNNKYGKKIRKDLIAEMERRGFTYYDWNVSADDSIGKPTEYSITSKVLNNFQSYCKPVILMHDSSINTLTVKSLPNIIKKIKEAGYRFDTVDKRTPCQFYVK